MSPGHLPRAPSLGHLRWLDCGAATVPYVGCALVAGGNQGHDRCRHRPVRTYALSPHTAAFCAPATTVIRGSAPRRGHGRAGLPPRRRPASPRGLYHVMISTIQAITTPRPLLPLVMMVSDTLAAGMRTLVMRMLIVAFLYLMRPVPVGDALAVLYLTAGILSVGDALYLSRLWVRTQCEAVCRCPVGQPTTACRPASLDETGSPPGSAPYPQRTHGQPPAD